MRQPPTLSCDTLPTPTAESVSPSRDEGVGGPSSNAMPAEPSCAERVDAASQAAVGVQLPCVRNGSVGSPHAPALSAGLDMCEPSAPERAPEATDTVPYFVPTFGYLEIGPEGRYEVIEMERALPPGPPPPEPRAPHLRIPSGPGRSSDEQTKGRSIDHSPQRGEASALSPAPVVGAVKD